MYGTKVVITKQNDIGFGYTLTRIIHIETHDVDKDIKHDVSKEIKWDVSEEIKHDVNEEVTTLWHIEACAKWSHLQVTLLNAFSWLWNISYWFHTFEIVFIKSLRPSDAYMRQ